MINKVFFPEKELEPASFEPVKEDAQEPILPKGKVQFIDEPTIHDLPIIDDPQAFAG